MCEGFCTRRAISFLLSGWSFMVLYALASEMSNSRGDVGQHSASVLSDTLVVNICPAAIDSTAPHPHVFP